MWRPVTGKCRAVPFHFVFGIQYSAPKAEGAWNVPSNLPCLGGSCVSPLKSFTARSTQPHGMNIGATRHTRKEPHPGLLLSRQRQPLSQLAQWIAPFSPWIRGWGRKFIEEGKKQSKNRGIVLLITSLA